MNKSIKFLVLVLLAGSLFLSSCGTPVSASSWPGMTVEKDTLYASYAGGVYSIRAADGNMNWRFPEPPDNAKTFYAAPVAAGDQVLVGDYAGSFYSLDASTGSQKWAISESKSHWIASPLVVNDTILAPSADNTLYALDLTGKLRWKFTTKYALWSQPVSDGKTVYLASMDHSLYALNIENGSKIWATDLGGAIVYSPVLDPNGSIYVGTLANEMLSVNSVNGKIQWKFDAGNGIWSKAVVNEDALYFGNLAGTIYSLNTQTGRSNWKLDAGGSITATGALYPDGLVFATENGKVLAVSYTGQKLWNKTFTGSINSGPVVTQDSIILAITGADNLLVAVDFKGSDKWTFAPPK